MKALSIRQPWAFAITHGRKDVENRTWPTNYRGPVLIHASKGLTRTDITDFREFIMDEPALGGEWLSGRRIADLPRGGIVAAAEIVDCVTESRSPWFVGPFGLVLANVIPLPLVPCKGMLGLFDVPSAIHDQIRAEVFG